LARKHVFPGLAGHRALWPLVPVEIQLPYVSAALAAGLAIKLVFEVGQAAADRDRVAAAIVGAVHETARISAEVIFCGRLSVSFLRHQPEFDQAADRLGAFS
jgi:hypothetical protein